MVSACDCGVPLTLAKVEKTCKVHDVKLVLEPPGGFEPPTCCLQIAGKSVPRFNSR